VTNGVPFVVGGLLKEMEVCCRDQMEEQGRLDKNQRGCRSETVCRERKKSAGKV